MLAFIFCDVHEHDLWM